MKALAFLLIASTVLGLLSMVPTPASATASDTHYVVTNASCVAASNTNRWDNANCFSHASGGAGGAGIPTATNDVIIDSNSLGIACCQMASFDAAARDITIKVGTPPGVGNIGTVGAGFTLTFRSFIVETGALEGGFEGWDEVRYSGTLDGDVNSRIAEIPAFVFTGTGDYGTARDFTFENVDASGGPTVYCFPGCTDDGGNVNVVFAAPPATLPACAINDAFPGLVAILLAVLGASVIVLLASAWLGFRTGAADMSASRLELLVGLAVATVVVIILASVLASNLQCG